jgi:hypothetical protein
MPVSASRKQVQQQQLDLQPYKGRQKAGRGVGLTRQMATHERVPRVPNILHAAGLHDGVQLETKAPVFINCGE